MLIFRSGGYSQQASKSRVQMSVEGYRSCLQSNEAAVVGGIDADAVHKNLGPWPLCDLQNNMKCTTGGNNCS